MDISVWRHPPSVETVWRHPPMWRQYGDIHQCGDSMEASASVDEHVDLLTFQFAIAMNQVIHIYKMYIIILLVTVMLFA